MHVALVHDRVSGNDTPDAVDVLAQAEAVEAALTALGHTAVRMECDLDLAGLRRRIRLSGADLVINLVESIEGKGRLIHLVPSLLDAMEMPYTGARAEAMLLTSNKLLAKQWMAAADIPTPPWISPGPGTEGRTAGSNLNGDAWIVKSVWEHASIGLDARSILREAGPAAVLTALTARAAAPGCDVFAEGFVAGREFNLSLLSGPEGPEVLPPAEIIFEGYNDDMPRIVDYRTKWDETAYGYHHTPRRFDFPPSDRPLLERLTALARRCWTCFGLCGYVRVDFRVDEAGGPWVLEVNANPCLSPDAGFSAALERAGISIEAAVERIINASHSPHL